MVDESNEKMETQFQENSISDGDDEITVEAEESKSVQGSVHISEDVITELAKRALSTIDGVQAGSPGLASKLGLGRKATEGVRISLDENKGNSEITVDVYVMVKYGLRIPDKAWDVQECVKTSLEELTGYIVKAVNVNVQGIFFAEDLRDDPEDTLAVPDEESEPSITDDANDAEAEQEKPEEA